MTVSGLGFSNELEQESQRNGTLSCHELRILILAALQWLF